MFSIRSRQPLKPSDFGGWLLVRYRRPVAVVSFSSVNLPVRGWSLAKRWKRTIRLPEDFTQDHCFSREEQKM